MSEVKNYYYYYYKVKMIHPMTLDVGLHKKVHLSHLVEFSEKLFELITKCLS